MKTIKQIADEIGVTKQAVHQKRKSKELLTALQPFTSTVDGVVYISVDGENLIKSAFLKSDRKHVGVNESSTVDASFTPSVDGQNELYSILKAELLEKNKLIDKQQQTIDKLTDALALSQQTTQAAQVLHATERNHLTTSDSEMIAADALPSHPEHSSDVTISQSRSGNLFSWFFRRKQM